MQIIQKMAEGTGTSSLNGPQNTTTEENVYSILRELLSSNGGENYTDAYSVRNGKDNNSVRGASSTSNSNGSKTKTTTTTSKTTSNAKRTYQDAFQNRGKGKDRAKIKDLGRYMYEHELFSPEEYKRHTFARKGTEFKHPRAYEIYLDLCERDWDKRIQQATDIARDHVPAMSYRERLDEYEPTGDIKGELMYTDYQHLFSHHGITREKLQKWFRTLFSDNGKKNTIYMWGKADAGKTSIIRLFDAFYYPWEIGRASAQNINSNFWLQDLYEKRLFHCDEIVATPRRALHFISSYPPSSGTAFVLARCVSQVRCCKCLAAGCASVNARWR